MIIKITIDRFESDKAVLITEDGENIIWPKKKLPENSREGSSLMFAITGNKEDKTTKNLAKNILNEILNIDDTK